MACAPPKRKIHHAGAFDFSTRMILPFHSVSSQARIAASASSSLSKDKNPKPRESPVRLSRTTRALVTRPNLQNFFSKSRSVVA
uniref:Uncharacterized protein n=1 Tax=Zea mays TaxID=4577 RepID=C4J488_MAIZE|nr:unknown [Zea mays]